MVASPSIRLRPVALLVLVACLSANALSPAAAVEVVAPAFELKSCHKSPETGNCKAHLMRWAFNNESGKCRLFVYGGCGGNQNNFETKEECMERCGHVKGAKKQHVTLAHHLEGAMEQWSSEKLQQWKEAHGQDNAGGDGPVHHRAPVQPDQDEDDDDDEEEEEDGDVEDDDDGDSDDDDDDDDDDDADEGDEDEEAEAPKVDAAAAKPERMLLSWHRKDALWLSAAESIRDADEVEGKEADMQLQQRKLLAHELLEYEEDEEDGDEEDGDEEDEEEDEDGDLEDGDEDEADEDEEEDEEDEDVEGDEEDEEEDDVQLQRKLLEDEEFDEEDEDGELEDEEDADEDEEVQGEDDDEEEEDDDDGDDDNKAGIWTS